MVVRWSNGGPLVKWSSESASESAPRRPFALLRVQALHVQGAVYPPPPSLPTSFSGFDHWSNDGPLVRWQSPSPRDWHSNGATLPTAFRRLRRQMHANVHCTESPQGVPALPLCLALPLALALPPSPPPSFAPSPVLRSNPRPHPIPPRTHAGPTPQRPATSQTHPNLSLPDPRPIPAPAAACMAPPSPCRETAASSPSTLD